MWIINLIYQFKILSVMYVSEVENLLIHLQIEIWPHLFYENKMLKQYVIYDEEKKKFYPCLLNNFF